MKSLIRVVGVAVVAVGTIPTIVSSSSSSREYHVPSFTVNELQQLVNGNHNTRNPLRTKLQNALSTTGLLAIQLENDDGDYEQARSVGFQGLCSCATYDANESIFRTVRGTDAGTMMMSSSSTTTTTRTTLATATVGFDVPLSLPVQELTTVCGTPVVESMETLRDIVSDVSQTFIHVLDQMIVSSKANDHDDDENDNLSSSSSKCTLCETSRRRQLQQHHHHSPQQEPLLKSITGEIYPTIRSIVESSTNLEHFHVYRRSSDDSTRNPEEMFLNVHTDAGLFLSFVPGLRCHDGTENENTADDDSSDLYVQMDDSDHHLAKAIFPSNSVGILLGVGAQNWLQLPPPPPTQQKATAASAASFDPPPPPPKKTFLQATKHAVSMPSGTSRAWYGKMHLVPPQAIIQEFPTPRTFADMRQAMVVTGHAIKDRKYSNLLQDEENEEEIMSIGCGSSNYFHDNDAGISSNGTSLNDDDSIVSSQPHRRRLQMVDNAGACNNSTNFYCWMSCLAIPDSKNSASYVDDGKSLYCADPSILAKNNNNVAAATSPCNAFVNGKVVVGDAMNVACVGVWQPTAAGVPSSPVNVPNNTSTNNSTSNRDSTLPSDPTLQWCYGGTSMYMDGFHWIHPVCVIYLFPSWIISSVGQMIGACIGTILFGMLLEGIIRQRRNTVTNMDIGYKRLCISTLYYGTQLSMGYLIMLIVMTYSGPLFVSCIIGLMGGHFVFNVKDVMESRRSDQHKKEDDTSSITQHDQEQAVSSNPSTTVHQDSMESIIVNMDHNNNNYTNSSFGSRYGESGEAKPMKNRGFTVPEGCTPCCQNEL